MAKRLSPGFFLRSGCSSKRIFYFFLRHFRCPTTVVQLPHSCGATASQLWCNCPTAVGQRKYPLEKQKVPLLKKEVPLVKQEIPLVTTQVKVVRSCHKNPVATYKTKT